MDKTVLGKRLKSLQKNLASQKIDAFLITDRFNIQYLSHFTGTNGQILITPHRSFLITDFRYINAAKKILPKNIKLVEMKKGLIETLEQLISKYRLKKITFEEKNLSVSSYRNLLKKLPKIKLKPSTDIVEKLRITKDKEELKNLIKAQRIAEKVFLKVKKNLKPGKTEKEIAWEIEKLGHEYGADTISFPPIVGFQENSASPHHQNSDRKLKKGDVVLIDMGMQYHGYCSDMTRMIFTQKPTEKQIKVYNIVLEAQEKSIKKLQAGVKGKNIDQFARKIITKAGYGKYFGHSLGHGIGLEVHEKPTLSKSYKQKIPENAIVTDEPGIYLENNFGIRIEDMLLIRRNNALNLTKTPKKIEDCIFLI